MCMKYTWYLLLWYSSFCPSAYFKDLSLLWKKEIELFCKTVINIEDFSFDLSQWIYSNTLVKRKGTQERSRSFWKKYNEFFSFFFLYKNWCYTSGG